MNRWKRAGLFHPMMPLFTFQHSPGLTSKRMSRDDVCRYQRQNTALHALLVMIPLTCLPHVSEMPSVQKQAHITSS